MVIMAKDVIWRPMIPFVMALNWRHCWRFAGSTAANLACPIRLGNIYSHCFLQNCHQFSKDIFLPAVLFQPSSRCSLAPLETLLQRCQNHET